MKKSQFKQLVKEEIRIILKEAEPATTQPPTTKPTAGAEKPAAGKPADKKVAGSADFTAVAKTLGVNPQQLTSAITLVKQNKALNNAQNKILADLVINMIKTQNDKIVQDFANQVKKLEVK